MDPRIPIILDRPFLVTTRAIIDDKNHKHSLAFGKDKIELALSLNLNLSHQSSGMNFLDQTLPIL